jgi:hypothetical protein
MLAMVLKMEPDFALRRIVLAAASVSSAEAVLVAFALGRVAISAALLEERWWPDLKRKMVAR